MLLCKVLWNFDLALAEGLQDWVERCRPYTVWEKPDLHVYVRPRQD